MNIQGMKTGYVFARNPIVVQDTFPAVAFDKNGGKLTLKLGGENVYESRFFPPLSIDISEILDSCVTFFPEPPLNNDSPIIEVEDAGELGNRICYILAEYDSYESEVEFTVVPGGISKQNYKRLFLTEQDAFSARFLNVKNNFFLTTRTAGWRVVVKETELYPLYFIIKQQLGTFKVVEKVTNSSLTFEQLESGVFALDVNALRRRFMTEHNVIPNVFDIYADGSYACRIVVERSDMSKQRYRLKFRNSLGVFEVIELTGEISVSPDYTEAENSEIKCYDSITGCFYTDRARVERKQSITVETGVKRPDEIRFLMDMIGSEEVYLLDLTPLPLKIIPSVEEFSYKPQPTSPEKITIKLDISDSETNIMQDILDGNEGHKPRVFSKQFTQEFH